MRCKQKIGMTLRSSDSPRSITFSHALTRSHAYKRSFTSLTPPTLTLSHSHKALSHALVRSRALSHYYSHSDDELISLTESSLKLPVDLDQDQSPVPLVYATFFPLTPPSPLLWRPLSLALGVLNSPSEYSSSPDSSYSSSIPTRWVHKRMRKKCAYNQTEIEAM